MVVSNASAELLSVPDRRVEHSQDLRVNSYRHRGEEAGYKSAGGGVGGLTTAVRPYSLIVRNVPVGLTRAGLSNMFSQFGDLLQCQVGAGWGRIAYSSGVEAATAIANMDRREPHMMEVNWQMDKEVREKRIMVEQKEKEFADEVNKEFDKVVASKVRWETVEIVDTSNCNDVIKEVGTDTVTKQVQPVASLIRGNYQYNHPLSADSDVDIKSGSCSRCSGPGLFVCSACSAWYCSQYCQADQWHQHRLHCGSPPSLIRVVEVGKEKTEDEFSLIRELESVEETITNETIGDSQEVMETNEVVVSYLSSPTLLYIQKVDQLPRLASLMSSIQSDTLVSSSHPSILMTGPQLFLAHCEGVWFRVKVISISPNQNMVRVFLIDYGNIDVVHVDKIRALLTHMDVPGMARRVRLSGVEEETRWSREELDSLRAIVGEGKEFKLKIIDSIEDGKCFTLGNDQGRNVCELWKERIKKLTSSDVDQTVTDSDENNVDLPGSGLLVSKSISNVNTGGQMSSNAQEVSNRQIPSFPTLNLDTNTQMSSICRSDSDLDYQMFSNKQTKDQVLPAHGTTVVDQLSLGSKVQLLKVQSELWTSFKSICVEELGENEAADFVLGALQVEGETTAVGEKAEGGDRMVAWNKDDQMFYRVEVISKKLNQDKKMVFNTLSIDFGREEVYIEADLRRSWKVVEKWPALGIRVESEGMLNSDIQKKLNTIGKDGITMEVVERNAKKVILAKEVDGNIVRWTATSVLTKPDIFPSDLNFTVPPPTYSLPPPQLPAVPPPLSLPPGLHTVNLLSANSPASLFICSMSQYTLLTTTVVPTIQSLAATSIPVKTPVKGSLVLVSYGGMWHRAMLVMVSQDLMMAKLLDLGHTIPVTMEQMLVAQPAVRSWPATAVPCVLAEWAGMARKREVLDNMKDSWKVTMEKLLSKFQHVEIRVLYTEKSGLHVLHVPSWEEIVKRGGGGGL